MANPAPSKLLVNGQDMGLFGMWVEAPAGWADGPVPSPTLLDVQGAGSLLVGSASRLEPRHWTVPGVLIAASALDALAQWDAAKAVLTDTWLDVQILPWTDRMCVCRLERMEWTEGRIEDYGFRFRLGFFSPSSYLVAPVVDSYGLVGGGEIALTLGTAPSPFQLQFVGPSTTPTLTYYDANGQVKGTVRLTGTLAAGEWWHFDSQTYLMVKYSATGDPSNGATLLSNSSRLFQLEPRDGTPDRGPSIALDVGSAVLYTRKCFS